MDNKITSNIALRSSSRKRNGIFDTCKRFCAAFELFVDVDDEPFGVIVFVDWGDEEFDGSLNIYYINL